MDLEVDVFKLLADEEDIYDLYNAVCGVDIYKLDTEEIRNKPTFYLSVYASLETFQQTKQRHTLSLGIRSIAWTKRRHRRSHHRGISPQWLI